MRLLIRALVIMFFGLVACTETTTTSSGFFGDDVDVKRTSLFKVKANVPFEGQQRRGPSAVSRGNDQFVNPSKIGARRISKAVIVPHDGELVSVSLVNASISAAAKAVLGETLGKRYAVSSKVSGNITIQSTGPIPKRALLELFEAALSANGARLEQSGQVVKVLPGSSGNRTFRLASEGVGSGASIIVAPLEFISAIQMVNLLAPLVSEGLTAIADKRRNLVMMTGEPSQLEAALDALNLFDVDVLSGKSIALIQLNSAEPDAIVDELKVIFETEDGGSLDGVIEFIPNKRLGSVLVITSRSKYLSKAQKWIRQLDRTASGAKRYIDTYELQNRSAVTVAPILAQLLSEGAAEGQQDAKTKKVSSGARVAADKERNALIVRASRNEHREIHKLLQEIDSSPQQVLLEATIAEVTLNDEVGLGVRWFFRSGNFNFTFSDTASGSTGSTFPGFSAVFGVGGADAALNALAGVTDIKIISSPTLMVLDNQEAILQIGDQVPIATQTAVNTSSSTAPIVTTVEYRDTGIILRVKPSISRNGNVILDIQQEVSNVAATTTSGIDSPTIRQRKISTHVLLHDGSTLALGGLIQESDNTTTTKVPGLGDAPVIGALFRSKKIIKRRSELLILIRPRVVSSRDDAKTVTDYWRQKLSGANTILKTGLGSPKHKLTDIIK